MPSTWKHTRSQVHLKEKQNAQHNKTKNQIQPKSKQ